MHLLNALGGDRAGASGSGCAAASRFNGEGSASRLKLLGDGHAQTHGGLADPTGLVADHRGRGCDPPSLHKDGRAQCFAEIDVSVCVDALL